LDAVAAVYDWRHGEPFDEASTKFGGETLGSIGGGWAAGSLWGSFVGPEVTLIVGMLGAIAGGMGGEKIVNWMLGH
jgi:outer membrane lipoprotein SlyB